MRGKRTLDEAYPAPSSSSLPHRSTRQRPFQRTSNASSRPESADASDVSIRGREALGRFDQAGSSLGDEGDKESMIREESEHETDPREGGPHNNSTLEAKIVGCKKLLELKERYRESISNRRLSLCGNSQRVRASEVRAGDGENSSLSVSQRWRLYVSTLDPEFFHETSIENEHLVGSSGSDRVGASRRGNSDNEFSCTLNRVSQGYSGLRIHEHNNADVAEIFRKKWQAKALRGQPISCYAQFRACVGQFARFCVTLKIAEAEEICNRGTLLRLVSECRVVEGFVGFWQMRALSSTVYSKVTLLKILVREAWGYFGLTSDETKRIKARDVNEYLMSVAAAEKTETRRSASGRRQVDVRAKEGRLFLPSDFDICLKTASRKLAEIIDTATSKSKARSSSCVVREFRKKPALIRKWNINLIAFLMLTAGGQRPQVFGQLRCPDGLSLAQIRQALSGRRFASQETESSPEVYFELEIVLEKRVRTHQFPNVLFPAIAFRFIEFHCKFVRPFILGKCADARIGIGNDGEDVIVEARQPERSQPDLCDEATLLIHTETGNPVTVGQVRATWKAFVCQVDPELAHVTPMVLRASFATYLIHRYRLGQMFRGLSEASFLDRLAGMMNTSAQMLRDVYCGCDPDDYRSTAIEMMQIYASPDAEERPDNGDYMMPGDSSVTLERSSAPLGSGQGSRWRGSDTRARLYDAAPVSGGVSVDDVDLT
jgi:hypothetical protein